MELAPALTSLRTKLCVIVTGFGPGADRSRVWTDGAEEFLRRMHKLGIHITIVGTRPPKKFGSKRTIRFMDRHEVVTLKQLAASRSHRLEFRLLNPHTQTWTRLRAEACVVLGEHGLWPAPYPGWTQGASISLQSLSRMIVEDKYIPGRSFAFLGSTNHSFRWGCLLLDRGAVNVHVVEEKDTVQGWRAYRDRFIAKGGRILTRHTVDKVIPSKGQSQGHAYQLYLKNDQGKLILDVDVVVLNPQNTDALNRPEQWQQGLFYVHRRASAWDQHFEEERWLESLDWKESYWRVCKLLDLVDYAESDGALKQIKKERKEYLAYRDASAKKDLTYSGKILDRAALQLLAKSPSVPKSFNTPKPVASLECLENIPCRACADACPDDAIELDRLTDQPRILSDLCTGCGACVAACPAGVAVMVRELPNKQSARYFLADDTQELWKPKTQVQMLNRRGEVLGAGRVVSSQSYANGPHRVLEIDAPNIHMLEARNFKFQRKGFDSDLGDARAQPGERAWVMLNGARRLSPVGVSITVALRQMGLRRFQDALYCHDGGCRLCEVTVDGKRALACTTRVEDGMTIEAAELAPLPVNAGAEPAEDFVCPCSQVKAPDYQSLIAEGASEKSAREITGVGLGTCHGRWCLGSCEKKRGSRPVFHGFEGSPWRDIWIDDVKGSDEA